MDDAGERHGAEESGAPIFRATPTGRPQPGLLSVYDLQAIMVRAYIVQGVNLMS